MMNKTLEFFKLDDTVTEYGKNGVFGEHINLLSICMHDYEQVHVCTCMSLPNSGPSGLGSPSFGAKANGW